MGLFSSGLSGADKAHAITLIKQLQTIVAYQQLSMEIYNDAVYSLIGTPGEGDEIFNRPISNFGDPKMVDGVVIPALKEKIQIIQLMNTMLLSVKDYSDGTLRKPYEDMSLLIRTSLERANHQYEEMTKWILNPQLDTNPLSHDQAEMYAMTNAMASLNDLISQAGLSSEKWLGIVYDAFNNVRAYRKLAPFSQEIFLSRYMRGMKGERVRFFTD